MRLKISAIIMALIMASIGGSLAGAESTITQVTHNSFEDIFPQIEGNYVVWQGRGGLVGAVSESADWEIFLYNIASGQTTQITDDSYDNLNPGTDGIYVVWWADKPSGAEVWLYDINMGEKKQISPPNADDENHYLPVIANGKVAWMGFTRSGVILREMWLYYCVTGDLIPLTDNVLDDSSPRINDDSLIWVQTGEGGATSLFIYDLDNGTVPSPVPDGFVWPHSPQNDGDLTVSTQYDGDDNEVFVHNANLGIYERITVNNFEDSCPVISGSLVAWVGREGNASEIFLASYDSDGDGIPETDDNCPTTPNPNQTDFDSDGIGDACDDDVDGDGHLATTDCDDFDPSIHPGACDIKRDGIDQDCDGQDRTSGRPCNAGGDDGGKPDGTEGTGKTCSDGIDNDGDGLIDCNDPDCSKKKSCRG